MSVGCLRRSTERHSCRRNRKNITRPLHGIRTSPDEDGTGKLADLIVLDRDPFQTDASALATIRVERTMVGGKWMYES